jgi:hypothetical protein
MLWLTTWGITMAVAHAGVMDAAIAVTDELVPDKISGRSGSHIKKLISLTNYLKTPLSLCSVCDTSGFE